MDSASEEVVALSPAVLTAVFLGLAVIILAFLKKLFSQDTETGEPKHEKLDKIKGGSGEGSSKHQAKKEQASAVSKNKKKLTDRENRRITRSGDKGFTHPWLLASLKGHTGRVLDMDFAANGKYLVSCGDEDPDPGGQSNVSSATESSSDSNKENSQPSSQSHSPVLPKGLTRRQRKNRKREQHVLSRVADGAELKNDIADADLECKSDVKKGGGKKGLDGTQKHKNQEQCAARAYKHKSAGHKLANAKQELLEPLEEYKKLTISEENFARILAQQYSLRQESMAILGYPVRPTKRPTFPHEPNRLLMRQNPNTMMFEIVLEKESYDYQRKTRSEEINHRLDVHAEEFVPKNESGDSGQGSEGSGSSSEEESSSCSSEASDDLAPPAPKLISGTIQRKDVHHRICVRCGSFFYTTSKQYITTESCIYHWGKLRTLNHRYGPMKYTCCGASGDSMGCSRGRLHVWNGPAEANVNSSYVETERPKSGGFHGVYSIDCEMSYTVAGLEVVKVTVVDITGRPVYNEFVQPKNEIVDFNTRFSGISKDDFTRNKPKSLCQVQKDIKKIINSETVLIGHGLENDLKALKIIHKTIVDTAFTFPHDKGYPYKHSLKSLTKTCLKRDIQCSSNGHDPVEDARACMELMLYRLRRDFNM